MKPFRFLHAADLHLDSPFRGLTLDDPKLTERIRRSTLEAFDNLVALALERHVDFVVVAGDVYDGADRSVRAQLHFRDGLVRLAERGIETFVAHGNHDPLDSRVSTLAWPDAAHFFGPCVETNSVVKDGEVVAVVSGYSFPKKRIVENIAKDFRRSPDAPFHIGVLHCNVGSDTGHDAYAPCDLSDLVRAGLDYWALGHVHTRQVLHERPHVVYPGNSQGRHVREPGPRGCYVVDVDSTGDVRAEFEALDTMRWDLVTVSIDTANSLDDLDDRLVGAVETASGAAEGRPLLCRVTLDGRGPLHRELTRESASNDLLERMREVFTRRNPFVWVQDLEIRTRPQLDLDERSQAEDLLAQVLRAAGEIRANEERFRVLRTEALARLFENSRAQKALDALSDEDVRLLIDDAEALCVERLEHAQ